MVMIAKPIDSEPEMGWQQHGFLRESSATDIAVPSE